MQRNTWEDFWWNNITGPRTFVVSACDALMDNAIAMLIIPPNLPWPNQMQSAISYELRQKTPSELLIEPLEAKDDCVNDAKIGKLLLSKFASDSVQNGYREKSSITIQAYLLRNKVLQNRIVWVQGLSAAHAKAWLKFCKGYAASAKDGLFLLEVREPFPTAPSKSVRYIDYASCVSRHDVQLFNSFILNEKRDQYSDSWSKYIAAVSANLCEKDAEVSQMLIESVEFSSEEPISGVGRICEMPDYSQRGRLAPGYHVLEYYRSNRISELTKRVWEAQVQVVFPLIEMERIKFIEQWRQQIETALESNGVYQYGQIIHDPIELELGTLVYMISHQSQPGEYCLYLPDESAREWLRFLHFCRNQLAHANCCTPKQLNALLDPTGEVRQSLSDKAV